MKYVSQFVNRTLPSVALGLICAVAVFCAPRAHASGGSSSTSGSLDTAGSTTGKTSTGGSGGGGGGTSSGGGSTSGGGGSGGGSTTTTTVPTTTLTFTQPAAINGVIPTCLGTYSISAYYPTLYLLNMHLGVTSMNVPDGSVLYVTVSSTSGVILTGTITIVNQSGTSLLSTFCVPSTTLQTVTITDSLGNVLFVGH